MLVLRSSRQRVCENSKKNKMKGKLFQLHVAFASSFGQVVMGLLNVWPSYTSSIYSSNVTTPLAVPMTQAEVSLLGSLPSLGAMLGTALCGILINRLGRRNGGMVLALPYAISWAMISITTSAKVVLAARFLGGVAGGGLLVFAPIFISEVAEDSLRGALASGPILMYCSGTLLSYIFGWFLSYRIIIWLNLVFSVSCVALLMTVTESPVFLLRQKRDEDARESIAHYRGCSPSSMLVLDEFARLKQQINPAVELISITEEAEKVEEPEKEKLNLEDLVPEEHKTMSTIKMLFVSPSSLRAFLVVITLMTVQVAMGIVPVQVYAKTVFMQTHPASADMYTVLFASVLLCGSMVTTTVADKAGRRILVITSSAAVCVCMLTLGYLLQSHVAPPWLTVVVILCYCFSFMFGAGSVPYVLLAEVFVPEVQGLASMLIIEWAWFLNFAIIAVFPIMNSRLGIHGTFYVFACCALLNAIISYIILPETKGLSNEQIQERFLGRKKQ